jgi:hypothetical protein
VADDFWREAVALKRYRSHPMMLIGDEPQSYPSYRDIALPRIVVRGKEIILLSGFKDEAKEASKTVCAVVVDEEDKLQQAAKRNPDAVAFGYVAGEWIAAA